MQKVMPNGMVAHVWAQQGQSEARSSNGNLWFRDSTIYSYREPIAAFVKGTRGRTFVLITSDTFSMTTSQHMSHIRRALGYDTAKFYVPYVAAPYHGYTFKYDLNARNVKYLLDKARDYAAKLCKMHVRAYGPDIDGTANPENRCKALRDTFSEVDTYCEAFGVRKGTATRKLDMEALCKAIRDAHARFNHPKRVKARETAKARREAVYELKHAAEIAERDRLERVALVGYTAWLVRGKTGAVPSASFLSFEQRGIIQNWRNANRDKIEAMDRARWIAGDNISYYSRNSVALRVNGDMLETSQGATVPLDHAIKAFKFAKAVRARGESWKWRGLSYKQVVRVGHFHINAVDADGNITAGCHRIQWPEIERLAKLIGVFND